MISVCVVFLVDIVCYVFMVCAFTRMFFDTLVYGKLLLDVFRYVFVVHFLGMLFGTCSWLVFFRMLFDMCLWSGLGFFSLIFVSGVFLFDVV